MTKLYTCLILKKNYLLITHRHRSPNFYLLSYTTVNFGNTKNIEFVSVFGYAEVCPPLWKRHADGKKSKFMPIQQTERRGDQMVTVVFTTVQSTRTLEQKSSMVCACVYSEFRF